MEFERNHIGQQSVTHNTHLYIRIREYKYHTLLSNTGTSQSSLACVNASSTCWISSQLAVLNINATEPTLNASNEVLLSTTDRITIRGKGFDAGRISNNQFRFESNLTESLSSDVFDINARIHENLPCTSTMIVLTFDRLSLYNFGELRGQALVSEYASQTTELAIIEATNATITESTDTVTTDQSQLIVNGHGIHPRPNYLIASVSYNDSDTNTLQEVGANLIHATRTSLTFTFTNLQPSFSRCSVDADESSCTHDYIGTSLIHRSPEDVVSSFDPTLFDVTEIEPFLLTPETRIGKLLQVDPSIVYDNNILSADSETLTVKGSGWDINAASNNVALWIDSSSACHGSSAPSNEDSDAALYPIRAAAIDYNTTSKNIVIYFHRLSNHDVGNLCLYSSTSQLVPQTDDEGVVVAKVLEVIPTVFPNETSVLNADANMVTIFGRGFDSFEPTNNDLSLMVSDRA